LLQERHFFSFFAAAYTLAERKEYRALPILVEILRDCRYEAKNHADYVGQVIALFAQPGFDALVDLLRSEQPLVRRRASVGLLYSKYPNAREVFHNLLNDLDPEIREIASVGLNSLPPKS
jgi:HEAT repeat protein